jgi:hypothetical protein
MQPARCFEDLFANSDFSRIAVIVLRIANYEDCTSRELFNKIKPLILASALLYRLLTTNSMREARKMAATTLNQRIAGFNEVREQTETVAADRIAQNSLLSELPGMAFAVLTLAYIVFSLVSL